MQKMVGGKISNSGCTIIWMKRRVSKQVAVDVDNLGWRKTIEMGRCCSAIGTDVSTVEDVVTLQIRGKFFRLRNNVQPVTGRTKHGTYLG